MENKDDKHLDFFNSLNEYVESLDYDKDSLLVLQHNKDNKASLNAFFGDPDPLISIMSKDGTLNVPEEGKHSIEQIKNVFLNTSFNIINEDLEIRNKFFKGFRDNGINCNEGCTDKSIIKQLGLTHNQVWAVVRDWYTNGMYTDILQDEEGFDLEEICEMNMEKDEEDCYIE